MLNISQSVQCDAIRNPEIQFLSYSLTLITRRLWQALRTKQQQQQHQGLRQPPCQQRRSLLFLPWLSWSSSQLLRPLLTLVLASAKAPPQKPQGFPGPDAERRSSFG